MDPQGLRVLYEGVVKFGVHTWFLNSQWVPVTKNSRQARASPRLIAILHRFADALGIRH